MFRLAVVALFAVAGAAAAEEVKGIVKKSDATGNKLTLTIDGKDTTYAVAKDASFVQVSTMKGKKDRTQEKVETIEKGLAGITDGSTVTILTDKQDGREVVTSVKVTGSKAGDSPKKKKKEDRKKKKPENPKKKIK